MYLATVSAHSASNPSRARVSRIRSADQRGFSWQSIGELRYSFKDIMASMVPYYSLRVIAGLVFLAGTILMAYNLFMTLRNREQVLVRPPAVDSAYRV